MPEEALQAAFEIKTACDEISRRLLRWHWEHKPGCATALGALLDHIAQRQQESPDYYDRMPDLSGKNSWQQLDTTICMRVLLDPEKDAGKASGSAGKHQQPGCGPPRLQHCAHGPQRSSPRHRPDRRGAGGDPVQRSHRDALEDAYAGTAFRENELARYYRRGRGVICPAAGQRSLIASSRAPAEEKRLPPAVHPARAQSRASTAAPRAAKRAAAALPASRTAAHSNSGRSSSAKGPQKDKL